MLTFSRQKLQIGVLSALTWLILWNGSGEFRPSMDAMTYGALSKHILSTGDWSQLHYSEQAYAQFYQHPPLAIWMNALVFKFLGATDITQKILPTFFAAITVALVYLWGRLWRRSHWGFIAGIILLSSVRFTKYAVGFLLDPFLAAFLLGSVFCAQIWATPPPALKTWTKNQRLTATLSFCSGLFLTLAFMSKGLPALAGVVILGGLGVLAPYSWRQKLSATGFWILGAALPLLAWILFADGAHYLQQYWMQSVANRVQGDSLENRLGALKNLGKVYWPWLPFWIYGIFHTLRLGFRYFKRHGVRIKTDLHLAPALTAAGGSLILLGGLTYAGHFLEHYLVPFYPFAALVVADTVSEKLDRYADRILLGFAALATVYALLLAAFPIHVQGDEYKNPTRRALQEATQRCAKAPIHRLLFSNQVAGLWEATAQGLWYTPWDLVSGPGTLSPEASRADLLLARPNEPKHPDWIPTEIAVEDIRIFQTKAHKAALCSDLIH